MPRLFQIFSQSDYLIQNIHINSHIEWQIVQIQISWSLQKPTDLDLHSCKGRVYPVLAGQGLIKSTIIGNGVSFTSVCKVNSAIRVNIEFVILGISFIFFVLC